MRKLPVAKFYFLRNIAALLVVFAISSAAQTQDSFRVTGVDEGDALNMRSAPKINASVVGKIPAQAAGIVRAGECKSWCRVRYGTVEGWVDRRFLAPEEARPSARGVGVVSLDPIGDCNSDTVARRLAGCAAILKDDAVGAAERAIAHSRRSDAYLVLGSLDEVLADRAKAYDLQSGDAEYKTRLSQAYRLRAGSLPREQADRALADYAKAIFLDPTNYQAFVGRSVIHLQRGEYEKAITDLHVAERIDSGKEAYRAAMVRLLEERGDTRLLKNEFDGAIADFTEAIKVDPKRATFYLKRAAAYGAKYNADDAVNDYSEAIRISMDNVEAYIGRGELYRRRNAFSAALADFDQAVQRQPSNITARMFRGLTREDVRDADGAIADYEAVLKLDTKHKLARAGIERLRVKTVSSNADREAVLGESPPGKQSVEEARVRRKQQECCLTYFQNVTNPQDVPHGCRIGVEQGTNFCSLIGVQAQAAKKTRGYSQNCCMTLPNGNVHCAFFPGCKRRPGDPTP